MFIRASLPGTYGLLVTTIWAFSLGANLPALVLIEFSVALKSPVSRPSPAAEVLAMEPSWYFWVHLLSGDWGDTKWQGSSGFGVDLQFSSGIYICNGPTDMHSQKAFPHPLQATPGCWRGTLASLPPFSLASIDLLVKCVCLEAILSAKFDSHWACLHSQVSGPLTVSWAWKIGPLLPPFPIWNCWWAHLGGALLYCWSQMREDWVGDQKYIFHPQKSFLSHGLCTSSTFQTVFYASLLLWLTKLLNLSGQHFPVIYGDPPFIVAAKMKCNLPWFSCQIPDYTLSPCKRYVYRQQCACLISC